MQRSAQAPVRLQVPLLAARAGVLRSVQLRAQSLAERNVADTAIAGMADGMVTGIVTGECCGRCAASCTRKLIGGHCAPVAARSGNPESVDLCGTSLKLGPCLIFT